MRTTRNRNIFLIGFSGCGKSTVGPLLARKLKARFHDTDSLIETRAKKSIRLIFEQDGEAFFRRLESNAVMKLTDGRRQNQVIAIGGGAFQNRQIRKRMLESGITVYLSCSVRELYRRLKENDDRPLLHGRRQKNPLSRRVTIDRISRLLSRRRDNYHRADIRIATTNRTVREIVQLLSKRIATIYDQH